MRTVIIMKRALTLFLILIMLIPASAVSVFSGDTDTCMKMLGSMSTEEKIAQMIMPSFRYTEQNGERYPVDTINGMITDLLERYYFSGVILYAENTAENEKAVRLIDAMQTANAAVTTSGGAERSQLLISIDQEGGIVTRLGEGSATVGNMALGAIGDPSVTTLTGFLIGEELDALGINVDFSPVVDVNINPMNPVIGVRSFSDDPDTVAEHGVSFMNGLANAGVISTLKHFPGHGDTATDSHTGMVVINKTYEELKQNELVPFRACVEAGVDMIMTAHIQFPLIETEKYVSITTGEEIYLPATLSETMITDILRGDMGFEGVVVTDAMNMEAISKHFRPLDSFALAVEAGVDIVLIPVELVNGDGFAQMEQYIHELAAMADSGTISMEKIDSAVLRILKLKEKYGLLDRYETGDIEARVEKAKKTVGSKEHHDIEWEIAKKSITLLKNDGNVLPISKDAGNITVLAAADNAVTSLKYAYDLLKDEGVLPSSGFTIVSYAGKTLEEIIPFISSSRYVIAATRTTGTGGLSGATAQLVSELIDYVHGNGGKFIVMSTYLPYDAARFQSADAIVLTYSSKIMSEDPRVRYEGVKQYGPNMPAALYLMFKTDESPLGRLPLDIPALNDDFSFSGSVLYSRGTGLRYSGFEDTPSEWAADEVEAAIAEGLVPEELRQFYRRPVTRGQVTQLFINLIEKVMGKTVDEIISERGLQIDTDKFTDTYDINVYSANALGVIYGTSEDRFSPEGTLKRAQIAAVINRIARLCGVETEGFSHGFTDITGNYEWADPELGWPVHAGIIKGVGDSRFSPGGDLTAEQAILITKRLLDWYRAQE